MLIQFTLQELIIFLIFALCIAVGIFLIVILWNIKKVVSILRVLLETNQEHINKSIKALPEIVENIGHISINVKETADKLKISVPVILQEVECVTNTAKKSIELAGDVIENMGSGISELSVHKKESPGYLPYFHIFEEIFQIIYNNFFSGK